MTLRLHCGQCLYPPGWLLLCLLCCRPVHGQVAAADPVAAETLFRQGLDATKAGDWEIGCQKFAKSMVLDPSVSTQFKLAKCSEHAGRLATAWYEYETALKMNREANVSERRRAELARAISAAAAALKPRVPMLTIQVRPQPAGLEIWRDGSPIAREVLGESLPIDPGSHELIVRAPGFAEARRQFDITEVHADTRVDTVEIELVTTPPQPTQTTAGAVVSPAAAPTPAAPRARPARKPLREPVPAAIRLPGPAFQATQDRDRSRWDQRKTGLVIGGCGVVALGIAGYFGIRTLSDVRDMDTHRLKDGNYDVGVHGPLDDASKAQTLGFVFGATGAALLGVGAALYFTAEPPKPNTASTQSPKSGGSSAQSPMAGTALAAARRPRLAISPIGVQIQGVW
jgi:hypothetical protein